MSPVSKGRKRKKSVRRKVRPIRRLEQDVDRDAYLGDLPPATPEDEVERTLARRVFAIPHSSAIIGGVERVPLDPADPDMRSVLIESEHPEFLEYLADPSWNGEIDGMNPRFHVTMHEVIANQLWDNEPPETWQAAERLRERGMERHDILHALARVMAEHIRPTLAQGEPFDENSYRRALTDLDPEG